MYPLSIMEFVAFVVLRVVYFSVAVVRAIVAAFSLGFVLPIVTIVIAALFMALYHLTLGIGLLKRVQYKGRLPPRPPAGSGSGTGTGNGSAGAGNGAGPTTSVPSHAMGKPHADADAHV
jgi:hypothetical protein